MAKSKQQHDGGEGGTATLEPPRSEDQRNFSGVGDDPSAKPPEPPSPPEQAKAPAPVALVKEPHEWLGKRVFYWKVTNAMTGEIGAYPAVLTGSPVRSVGWGLGLFTFGGVQALRDKHFSETPRAGYWTWPKGEAPPIVAAAKK